MATLVEVRNVNRVYVRGRQKIEVLHNINLDIAQGDFLARSHHHQARRQSHHAAPALHGSRAVHRLRHL